MFFFNIFFFFLSVIKILPKSLWIDFSPSLLGQTLITCLMTKPVTGKGNGPTKPSSDQSWLLSWNWDWGWGLPPLKPVHTWTRSGVLAGWRGEMGVGQVTTRVFPVLIATSYFLTVSRYRAPPLECCGTVGSVNGGAQHGDFLSPRSSQEGPGWPEYPGWLQSHLFTLMCSAILKHFPMIFKRGKRLGVLS